MDGNEPLSRRTVLKLAGSATAVALVTGCADDENGDEPDAEEGTGNGQDAADDDEHEQDDGEETEDEDQTTGDDEGDEDEGDDEAGESEDD